MPLKIPQEQSIPGPFYGIFHSISETTAGISVAAVEGVFRKSLPGRCLLGSRRFGQTPKPPQKPFSHGAATRPT